MERRLRLALAAMVLTIPVAVAPAQGGAAPAQRDWSRTVVATPEGGFRMGNPDAPVKIVSFLSLTCPHCATFAREGAPALIRNHVRSGRASLEYRNFVLNGVDAAASLLARCGGAAGFFPIADRILATQEQWMGRITSISQAQRDELATLGHDRRFLRLAQLGGLDAIAARHGVGAEQAARCLGDEAGLRRLGEMFQAAAALGVEGTPTFLINGRKVSASDWATLEPLIRQAGG